MWENKHAGEEITHLLSFSSQVIIDKLNYGPLVQVILHNMMVDKQVYPI